MLHQYKVTYILEMHKQGKIVRQVIHAQTTKGHIHAGNAQMRPDCQTGHSCSNNKRSHTRWKCTNEARWSDRSFMLNQQKITYKLEMHKQGKMVRQVIHAQRKKGHIHTGNATRQDGQRSFMLNQPKVTYMLEMHQQDKMVRPVIHAQSTKGSHTSWRCTSEARWSDRSFMFNQQKVTYKLEMHKQGKMVRQVIHAKSKKKGHIHAGNAEKR